MQRAIPAPLNYRGFPKSICTSVNHVVCHGIPGDRRLKQGDIINIDVTVIKDGWHGDTSRMFTVGKVNPAVQRLIDVTHEAMWTGIRQVRPGARIGDIGAAIQTLDRTAAPVDRARILRTRHRPNLSRRSAGAALSASAIRASNWRPA